MSTRIRYACPHCNRRIVHHAQLAGHLVICSACKGEFYEPTDPLPGKPAQAALQAVPDAPRRLRVPEGNNPRHDLAVLSRRDGSDLRTITEIVEAVLLDNDPPPPAPLEDLPLPAPDETINDFGYVALEKEKRAREAPAIPTWSPPGKPRTAPTKAPAAPPLSVTPAAPTEKVEPRDSDYVPAPLPAVPTLAGPPVRSLVTPKLAPPPVVASPSSLRSTPKPAVPGAAPSTAKPVAPLAGASPKQLVEELRRRGLGVALITCDMAPMRNFELVFSENMTRDDALVLIRKYLDALREPPGKAAPTLNKLKRKWRAGDDESEGK